MKNRKEIILKKVDLLIISLEALNMFLNEDIIEINKINYQVIKNKFSNIYKFSNIIEKIHNIRIIIKTYLIDEIAMNVIKDYTLFNNINIINKYNQKFYYIYKKKMDIIKILNN